MRRGNLLFCYCFLLLVLGNGTFAAGRYGVDGSVSCDDAGPGETSAGMVCPFTIYLSGTDVSCFGICDGVVRVDSVAGAVGPLYYRWLVDNSTADSLPNRCPGTYTVEVTDSGQVPVCRSFRSRSIIEPAELVVFATPPAKNATCFSICDGEASATAIDGTLPYTFTWSDGQTGADPSTHSVTGLCAGDYTVTVTDTNGCADSVSISITEPAFLAANGGQRNVQCNGACDGIAYVSPTGGTTPYSFLWDSGSTNDSLTALCPGTVNATVTDGQGCTDVVAITITEPPVLTTAGTGYNVSCGGVCDGAAALTVAGGTLPYAYIWAPGGETTDSLSGLCAGVYNVTITDANGCSSTESFIITEPAPLTSSITDTVHIACTGGCGGTATVTPGGGTSPFTYVWNNSQTDSTATGLCAGSYTVTVTDANGCTSSSPVTITQPAVLGNSLSPTNASCNGICDGSILSSPTGGTPPYAFLWSNGQTVATASGLCAGSYTVTVTDNNGCTISNSTGIAQPPALTSSITDTVHVSCGGLCDGSATVTPAGGFPPYSYLWSSSATDSTATGLCGGAQVVTVTDASGCTTTGSVTIAEPTALTSSITASSNLTCNGVCDGSATVTPSGGSVPYSFLWDGGQTTATATGMCAGTFGVTVTDNNGCIATSSVTLTEPPALTTTMSRTDPSCGGACDASATVTAGGGNPGYTYSWSNGCTTSTCSALCSGWIYVTVTDNSACAGTDSIEVPVTPIPALDSASTGVSCNGVCDGTMTITATGGSSPYTYSWSSGCATSSCTAVCSGSYTVTVTDATGCATTATVTVPGLNIISVNGSTLSATCVGICDGTVSTAATGGAPPYTYLWSTGCTTASCGGMCVGSYTVTITDLNGCTSDSVITVDASNPIVTTMSKTDVTCNGNCDGTATATPTGGSPPYTYSWSNSCSSSSCTALCAGSYTVTVTGSAGCFEVVSVTVTEPAVLTSSITDSAHVSCNGLCDGRITATPAGGTSPFTYVWSDAQTDSTATGLCAGAYGITVTDANGCQVTDAFTVNEPAVLVANESGTNSTCGNCDGSVTATPTGGTTPYSYTWSNGCSTGTCGSLCVGIFVVTVTDGNGCTATGSVTVSDIGGPTGEGFSTVPATCNGVCDGQATVTPVGGTPSYTYLWGNGQTNATATGLCAGQNNVTVTDANGCSRPATVTITEPAPYAGNISDTTHVSCNALCDGRAVVTPAGGTSPYSYLWSNSQTDSTATGLCAGLYNVTLTDVNGCTAVASIIITQPSVLGAGISDTTHVLCFSNCDGRAVVTPAGGTLPYTYLWNNAQSDSTATGLCAGSYTVTVTDGNGCTTTSGVTITEPSLLTASVINVNHVSCNGACDGSAGASPSGGTPGYTFSWSVGQTTQNAINLCAGAYTVTITDANGCTATSTVTITEPPALTSSITGSSNASCFANCDGQAVVTPAGGTLPYSYLWTGGATDSTATGLCAGAQGVTVTDGNGCTSVSTVTVTEPPAINLDTAVVNTTCGSCDGSVTAVATGGSGGFTYSWDNSCTAATCTSLCAGAYNLTVTDVNGCTATNTAVVSDIGAPDSATVATVPALCNGACNGSGSVTPYGGGGPPYNYQWNDPGTQTTATATGLCAGTYIVNISDTNGCTLPVQVTVTEPAVLAVTFTDTVHVDCNGNCTGSATAGASGGTPGYTFAWSDSQSGATATGLCAGAITVTVTDANLCISTNTVTITEPAPLAGAITGTVNILCNGNCDGSLIVTPGGGTAPFAYLWSDAQTDSTATGLCAGNYTVTVTDANLCQVTVSAPVTEPPVISPNPGSVNSTCGLCDGTVSVAPTGGTPGYTYLWDDAGTQTTPAATGLCSGLYHVTITDAAGCLFTQTVPLSDNGGPTGDTATISDVTCNGICDGSATVTVTGGLPPYSYQWDDPASQTGPSATGLCANTYYVIATDGNACKRIVPVTISQSSILAGIMSDTTHILCNGNCDGSAVFTPSGGTQPYVYSWSGGQTDSSATGLCAGTYTLTITDANACLRVDTVVIGEPPALTLNVTALPTTICFGDTAFVNANPGGGNGGYTFLWNDNPASTSQTIVAFPPDTFIYFVTVTDANGCIITGTDTLNIITPGLPVAGADTGVCTGDSLHLNGQILYGTGTVLWTSNGSGYFVPDSTSLITTYIPGAGDSLVKIYLTAIGACFNQTDTLLLTVGVTASVNAGPDQLFNLGTDKILLNGSIINAPGGKWTTNGRGRFVPSDTARVVTYIPDPTDYDLDSLVFTLTTTGNGCSMAIDIAVVRFIEVRIPNVFTPYPESPGINDVFYVDGLPPGSRLVVFNRWGIKVFQSDNYRNDWDGAGLKGDVYYYILTWQSRNWTGYVHLLKKTQD